MASLSRTMQSCSRASARRTASTHSGCTIASVVRQHKSAPMTTSDWLLRPIVAPTTLCGVRESSLTHAQGSGSGGGNPFGGLRQSTVTHAKGGGKGGGKGDSKSSGGGAALGDEMMKVVGKAKSDAEERMKKCLGAVADSFSSIRTGRANPAILDRVVVDYFGVPTPLKQVATITVPDAFTLMVSPFDKKALKDVEKALNISDLGLTPNNDGERIRLGLPSLTQDRRKELVKQVKEMTEEGKVAVRNVRKDAIKKAEKLELSKDGSKGLEDDIQKLTDLYIKKLEDLMKTKSDEVMKL